MRSATYFTWDNVKTRRGKARRSSSTSARMSLPFSSRTLESVPRSMPRTPEAMKKAAAKAPAG